MSIYLRQTQIIYVLRVIPSYLFILLTRNNKSKFIFKLEIRKRFLAASYFLLFSTTEKSAFTAGGYSSTGPYLFLCSVHTGGYSNGPLIKIGR